MSKTLRNSAKSFQSMDKFWTENISWRALRERGARKDQRALSGNCPEPASLEPERTCGRHLCLYLTAASVFC